ncbi:DUF1302 family protein [Algiphilus sp.]|uniref:DUF1302 domain-containing protein n=1 Tax=Algiphilus sp. TaxID=1872431 RepID=UPI0025BECBBF|nr:DUF1302 family protein [Algiphilus sp.]MCK5769036.1 DUF1302 family protein [Algiphilus sp.]
MTHCRVRNGLQWLALGVSGLALLGTAPSWGANYRLSRDMTLQVNTNIVAGASWRISDRAPDLVGKSNLDPDICSGPNQFCQGLARLQTHPAEALANSPGQPSVNFDDGNLAYDKGDIVQAPFRINQDFNLQFGDFGFFGRWLYFYDFENNDFTQYAPNRITSENRDDVVITGDIQGANRYLREVFSTGAPVRYERKQGRTLSQVGTDFQLLDLNFYGRVPLPIFGGRDLVFRIGRQTVNWGESTVLVVNSVNQANPANTNNLFRTGFTLDEVFTPVGMAFASINLTDTVSLEGYYQYEWDAVEIPPPGSFFSFLDVGTPNINGVINASFGGAPEDPELLGGPVANPLSALTDTTASVPRIADDEPSHQGQYGLALKWFLPDLNYGTEFGFYFMNYHSKLPYANIYSADASCARAAGNDRGIDATNTFQFLGVCSNVPIAFNTPGQLRLTADMVNLIARRPGVVGDLGLNTPLESLNLADFLIGNPNQPVDSVISFDSMRLQLEYPEDRQMFGISFNTPAGPDYSMQGEIAYRPNLPLQVSLVDLAFAGLGPSATICHREEAGCLGSRATINVGPQGDFQIYENSNFVDADGNHPYPDTLNLAVGAGPGVARAFPNFLLPYRGREIGTNDPNSFIRGWEPFDVLQYNLGATRIYGQSESILGADQIIMIYELGATHVLGFPDFDELQIEGPMAPTTHASAGADGSGADGSRQACSTNPACSVGPDGLRFNPYQASRDQFAHAFSWGYRIVSIIRYDSVLPGLSIEPTLIWGHDINGNSPGPGGNFVEGRKTLNSTFQFRYKTASSFNVSYQLFTGGGANHLLRDRDNLGFFIRYQF